MGGRTRRFPSLNAQLQAGFVCIMEMEILNTYV